MSFFSKNPLYLVLYDVSKDKQFNKYFDTEYEMDKFKKKLQYSEKLYIIKDSRSVSFDYEK